MRSLLLAATLLLSISVYSNDDKSKAQYEANRQAIRMDRLVNRPDSKKGLKKHKYPKKAKMKGKLMLKDTKAAKEKFRERKRDARTNADNRK